MHVHFEPCRRRQGRLRRRHARLAVPRLARHRARRHRDGVAGRGDGARRRVRRSPRRHGQRRRAFSQTGSVGSADGGARPRRVAAPQRLGRRSDDFRRERDRARARRGTLRFSRLARGGRRPPQSDADEVETTARCQGRARTTPANARDRQPARAPRVRDSRIARGGARCSPAPRSSRSGPEASA